MSNDPANRCIGPFQLDGRLGVGGMGIVYRATYLKGGQQVAVKVLAPDLTADYKVAKRFEREMAILKKLRHPNIVRYYGGGMSGQQQFYAMELVNGGSVDDLLRKQGRLSWETVVDYGMQIAKALEHAHDAAIIHRDLKPANLLLTEKGVIKLSDFGIARDTQSTALTQAGKTVGTMAYMAPEQITGKSPILLIFRGPGCRQLRSLSVFTGTPHVTLPANPVVRLKPRRASFLLPAPVGLRRCDRPDACRPAGRSGRRPVRRRRQLRRPRPL
ncbi:MAG: serine/threonine-protein kinase [Planctomycetaceae bacterium]